MTKALSNAEAIKEIKRIARDGRIRFSKNHFWKKQRKRKIDMTDVQRVIRGGYIEENSAPEYDSNHDVYKYRVWGNIDKKNICVVVALRHEENAIDIITVFED
ncbi:MAG: DUF4258 domain-containing protein [Pseudomonadota bacterium]